MDDRGAHKLEPHLTPERWQKMKHVFGLALECEPAGRSALLQEACKGDELLLAEVKALLAASEGGVATCEVFDAGSPMSVRSRSAEAEDSMLGRRIGAYRIERRIGFGGMASVYSASRADDEFRKQVAIKLLRPDLDNAELFRRFRIERQTLAALDHPNIVKLLDGGSTEEGLPYLVMDYVDGCPIDEYCDSRKLTIEQRLRLFCVVCEAVNTAHTSQIVHRDLKPNNILVTTDGNPKLLDFGIAKVLNAQDPVETLITRTATRRLTPAYASPEQARGETVTAATDVYSLGVVLYELLTGHRPYKLKLNTPAALERAICEEEPESPSTAVDRIETETRANGEIITITAETVSRTREGQPARLRRCLRGDLDKIVLKALQKDPRRRYESAKQLAADIWRHLEHRPIEARTSSLMYRASRLLWRHKTEMVAAGVVVLVLVAAFGFSIWEEHRAQEHFRDQVTRVRAHGRRSVAVLGFRNLSGRSDAAWLSTAFSEMLRSEFSAKGELRTISGEDVSHAKIDLSLPERDSLSPEELSRVYKNLGSDLVVLGSYIDVGDPGRHVRLEVRVQDAALGETVASLAESGSETALPDLVARTGADLRQKLGLSEVSPSESATLRNSLPTNSEALRLYAEGLSKLRAFDALGAKISLEKAVRTDPAYPLAHLALADTWERLGYEANAEAEARRAFLSAGKLSREQNLLIEARYHQAARHWEKAIEIYQALFKFFPDSLEYGLGLARVQALGNQTKDSLNTIEGLQKLPPPVGRDVRIDLAETDVLQYVGDFNRDLEAASRAADKAKRQGAPLLLAAAYLAQSEAFGHLSDNQRSKAAAYEAEQLSLNAGDRFSESRALRSLGRALEGTGDFESAKETLAESVQILHELGNRTEEAKAAVDLAQILRHQNQYEEAIEMYDRSAITLREMRDWTDLSMSLQGQGVAELNIGRLSAATTHVQEALSLDRAAGRRALVAKDLGILAEVRGRQGDSAAAKKLFRESIQIRRELGDRDGYATMLYNLAIVYEQTGDVLTAENLWSESAGAAKEAGNQGLAAMSLIGLGSMRMVQANLKDARRNFEEARDIIDKINPGDMYPRINIASLLLEEDRDAEAEALLEHCISVMHAQHNVNVEVDAESQLARSLLSQGKLVEAQSALEEAHKLLNQTSTPELHIEVGIVDGRVLAASGKAEDAKKTLKGVIEDARHNGFRELMMQAQLALGEVDVQTGESGAGRLLLYEVEKKAAALNYRLIAQKAATVRKQHIFSWQESLPRRNCSRSEVAHSPPFDPDNRLPKNLLAPPG